MNVYPQSPGKRVLMAAALIALAVVVGACQKKSRKGTGTAASATSSGPVAQVFSNASSYGADPNVATINVNLEDSASGASLDSSALTMSCAVPPTAATTACTGQADETSGQIKLPLTCLSPAGTVCQLFVGTSLLANLPMAIDATLQIVLNIDADKSTGAVSVTQIDVNGNEIEPPKPTVPDAVANLALASGFYTLTTCPGKAADADKNTFPDFAFCSGWTQHSYVNFSAGSAKAWPVLEFWRTQEAKDSCMESGELAYQLGDGTNTFVPVLDQKKRFDALKFKATLLANAWLPAGAVIRNKFSSPSLAPTTLPEGDADTIRDALASAYPGQSALCKALSVDLKKAWDAATLAFSKGAPTCAKVNASTPSDTINQLVNNKSDWLARCGLYRSGKGGYTLAKFVIDCEGSITAASGTLQRDQDSLQIVDSFLQTMSALRRSSGDDRFAVLRSAYAALPSDLSTLDSASATYDTQLIAFLKLWAGTSWDLQVTRAAKIVLANFTTAINSADRYLSQFNNKTGRAVLISWLQDTTKQAQINQALCGSGSKAAGDIASALKFVASKPSVATLFNDFKSPSSATADPAWKSTVSTAQMCTDMLAAFNDALASSGIGYCAKNALTNLNKQLSPSCTDQTANAWIYGAVKDAYFANLLSQVASKLADPDGDGTSPYLTQADGTYGKNTSYTAALAATDYAALKTAVSGLAVIPDAAWVFDAIAKIESAQSDPEARLYRLTQLAAEMISRQSFINDLGFRDKLLALHRYSKCMFDAALTYEPVDDGAGQVTYLATVRAPAHRQFSAPVHLSPNASSPPKLFQALDQRLQTNGSCSWGQRQDANNIGVDQNGNLTYSFSEVWINCNQDPNATAAANNPVVTFVQAAPVSN